MWKEINYDKIVKESENNEDTIKVNLDQLAYAEDWSDSRLDKYIGRIEKKYGIQVHYYIGHGYEQVGTKENLIKWLKSLEFEGDMEEIYDDAKKGKLSF